LTLRDERGECLPNPETIPLNSVRELGTMKTRRERAMRVVVGLGW